MDAEKEKFAARARELRELAAQISYEPDRQALIQVAEEYEKLAGRSLQPAGTSS